MPGFLLDRFAEVAARAHHDEDVEIFARRTHHVVVTRPSSGGPVQVERGTHWHVLVSSRVGGSSAVALTTDPSPAGLASTLDTARLLRLTVPQKALDAEPLADLCRSDIPPDLAPGPVDLAADPLSLALVPPDVATTVAHSVACVWLADSRGRAGCYSSSEAQIALRSCEGALGAALATDPDRLDIATAVADLNRERAAMALPRGATRAPSWLLLTPLATAQLLSHLAGGLLRAHYREETLPIGEAIGSSAVTLVDDGRPTGGPAGAPFDDEGVATRRTVIVRSGRWENLLSGLPLALSTGNARRRDASAHTAVAPSNLLLQPSGVLPADDERPSGVGVLVTRLSGVRPAALDLRHTPLRLTVHGATLRDGVPAERVQAVLAASAQHILQSIVAVAGPVRFYRVTGVFGGTTCLLDGVAVRPV